MPLPKFVRSNRIWVAPMGKTPQVTKGKASALKARRKVIALKGKGALVSLRNVALRSEQEILSSKLTSLFGQGARVVSIDEIVAMGKKISPTALKKTPSDSFELKRKLLNSARHFGEQRSAKFRIEKINTQLNALGKLKLQFATVATASDIVKLARMNMPKVDVGLIKRLAREDASLRPIIKMFESEIVLGKTGMEQINAFKRAQTKQGAKTEGRKVIYFENGVKKIVYSDFRDIQAETRKRAYAVSEVLNKLKQERDSAKRIINEKSKTNSEVMENARPLLKAYKKGEADKNRLRGVYEEYAKIEEEKEGAIRKASMEKRLKDLNGAKSTLLVMKQTFEKMKEATTFEEAIQALTNSEALRDVMMPEYVRLLNLMPELEKLRTFESIQLVVPENKEDVYRELQKHRIDPKKAMGKVVTFRNGNELCAMPTTIPELNAYVRAKLNAFEEAQVAIEQTIKGMK